MRRIAAIGLVMLVLFVACTVQETHLVYRPEPTADPTAEPTPTPTPQILSVPTVTGEPMLSDTNGVPIRNEKTHYYDTYVTLNDIRIYPYGEGMFLDGTLVNSFPGTLTGTLRVTFTGEDGVLYGYGDLYTAGGGLHLLPGENRIYADILTEVDVQSMVFTVRVIDSFAPEL